ncbi:carbon starvation induced protein CsiD [Helicobacter saguini]|uniref:Carbon starvation induced protein CsiD n=1 Tax=Helicobacter saguini TaxID=1548018 RepID=A0A347VSG3_9HELI|nr:glutarate dioxygenase GlaH [Helicobacter saguini]MWV62520.1 carbon starvation induced protein CsiD [Helicobacter saguini]MWV66806.1 carbon starvation induced protein CsiD [Helicobacter saguini]MWV69157.1 carbon starvation induced protein CsiD [Helicobacter saguini]MWV71288.1 carbon starvation induced protein CsiD [Helicobacter saguini]TLD94199.1 carbon starvation induced protein CsiD [Helicobacter saguini]
MSKIVETKEFSAIPSQVSSRLVEVTFNKKVIKDFLKEMEQYPVQALEYKSFLRFRAAQILNNLCNGELQGFLQRTLSNREQGALLINPEGINSVEQGDDMVKIATAFVHLVGRSNFDDMTGKFYARWAVVNTDNSDSYLRQPQKPLELHNDGTYVNQVTDYVLMYKIDEQNMKGGDSQLLHLDEWEDLDKFYNHHLAKRVMKWSAPPSKNVKEDAYHPVFETDCDGRPVMLYIDQFAQPKDFEEGTYLADMGDSLENSKNKLSFPVPVGQFLLINNLFWLHGRDKFERHEKLRRELMRQRGYFSFCSNPFKPYHTLGKGK